MDVNRDASRVDKKSQTPQSISAGLLVQALEALAPPEGFSRTRLDDVRLMHSRATHPFVSVTYDPSIVLIAQGRKCGRMGTRTFVYDAQNYLVLSVPLPFECETSGTLEAPMLGMKIRVDPTMVAELLLESDRLWKTELETVMAIDSAPITPAILDAAVRLAGYLRSVSESKILGPQTIREMLYHVLQGPRGDALRALVNPASGLSKISHSLRKIHREYAQELNVGLLAREAGMSVSTFHAHFKTVTAKAPLQYIQTVRLHKALVQMVGGMNVAEAAQIVGYESPSQFSREFKRLFGGSPREVARRGRTGMFEF
jgi:AraC-like DNA-binding protein